MLTPKPVEDVIIPHNCEDFYKTLFGLAECTIRSHWEYCSAKEDSEGYIFIQDHSGESYVGSFNNTHLYNPEAMLSIVTQAIMALRITDQEGWIR